jgi:hypothetical protein
MKFHFEFDIKKIIQPVHHQHKLLLVGSCFTENIGEKLRKHKFNVLGKSQWYFIQSGKCCRSGCNVHKLITRSQKKSFSPQRNLAQLETPQPFFRNYSSGMHPENKQVNFAKRMHILNMQTIF